jgi:hypothetical protein
MTSGETPGVETEGLPQEGISGYRLPDRGEDLLPAKEAVLFIPADHDEGNPLDVKVWTVNKETMRLIILRRC